MAKRRAERWWERESGAKEAGGRARAASAGTKRECGEGNAPCAEENGASASANGLSDVANVASSASQLPCAVANEVAQYGKLCSDKQSSSFCRETPDRFHRRGWGWSGLERVRGDMANGN